MTAHSFLKFILFLQMFVYTMVTFFLLLKIVFILIQYIMIMVPPTPPSPSPPPFLPGSISFLFFIRTQTGF